MGQYLSENVMALIKFLSLTIRSFRCQPRFQNIMVRSLASHDPFVSMSLSVPCMSSSVPSCRDLFLRIGPGEEGDVFVADPPRSDEGEVVVSISVVLIVVTSSFHEESECGCLTWDKYFCDPENCAGSGPVVSFCWLSRPFRKGISLSGPKF